MATSDTAPAILLFMVDQLSAKWLEAACDGACPTPNIDRLRGQGTTFTNAFSSNPVCMPTRATIATGLSTRGHGLLENGYQLDPSLPTFMRALQDAGWRTAALGKVHFQPHFRGFWPNYQQYGFDVTHITEDGRGGEWLDWVAANHSEYYEAVLATFWALDIRELQKYGPNEINLRQRIASIRRDFQWHDDDYPLADAGKYPLPFPQNVSQTAWITDHALDFIHTTPQDQPMFAQVSYVQPHGPYGVPREYLPLVSTDRLPPPLPAEWADDGDAPAYFADKHPHIDEKWRFTRQCYFADIAHLDDQLGQLLQALDRHERLDNTTVLFLSDHGDLLGDHGFFGKEERHYDACIRVPLIVAGPGLTRGAECSYFVQHEDICPTILRLADVHLPPMPRQGNYLDASADEIPQLPGHSLLPLCAGESPPDWRTAAYAESYNAIWSIDPGDWARTIRNGRFRYTLYPRNGEQLFDVQADPDEQDNLAGDPQYADVRSQLRDELLELIIMQDYPKTRRSLWALGVH